MRHSSVFVFFLCCSCGIEAYLQPDVTPLAEYLQPITIQEGGSKLPTIDCIYVINLDKRPERWLRVQGQLNRYSLQYNRVSAFDGQKLRRFDVSRLQGPYVHCQNINKGRIGCLISHLSIIKDALDRGFERIWILEDDPHFYRHPSAIVDFLNVLTDLDPDWDIFYTYDRHRIGPDTYLTNKYFACIIPRPDANTVLEPPVAFPHLRLTKTYLHLGTASLVISRKGLEKILDFYMHAYLWIAIDADLHYIPGIREYVPMVDLVGNWYLSTQSDTDVKDSPD